MSAVLLVVDSTRREHPWEGVIVNVRVDHHPAPLDELERLVHLAQSRQHGERAFELLESGDPAAALDATDAGLALAPGDADLLLIRACALVALGHHEEARSILVELVDVQAGWADALRALSRRGLLGAIDLSTLERLLP
jgi:thioredoxin-like negative regulator of GroEL